MNLTCRELPRLTPPLSRGGRPRLIPVRASNLRPRVRKPGSGIMRPPLPLWAPVARLMFRDAAAVHPRDDCVEGQPVINPVKGLLPAEDHVRQLTADPPHCCA